MKRNLALLLLAFVFSMSTVAEARVGAGRSSGSRGSRGFSPPPSRSPSFGGQSSPRSPSPFAPSSPFGGNAGGGSFLRGMAGGMAGGLLGSMLFRGLGGGMGGYGGYGGGGGIGFLDILLFAGVAYLIYRFVIRRRLQAAQGPTYSASLGVPQDYTRGNAENFRSEVPSEVFQDRALIDSLVDSFFKIQAAWMHRDLSSIRSVVTPEMNRILEEDANKLKVLGRLNKLENITMRESEITESWSEGGKEFVTLRLLANVLDYTVDEATNSVVEGDRNNPVKFEEYWTFVRERGQALDGPWQLSAIQNF